MNKPLVIYIVGDNRSGSTLLDYLLLNHPETVSIGEVHSLDTFFKKEGIGMIFDWKCTCGSHVHECEFWSKIIEEVSFDDTYKLKPNLSVSKLSKFSRLFKLLKMVISSQSKAISKRLNEPVFIEEGKQIAINRWKIYDAVAKISGRSIIIDSSKSAEEAYLIYKQRPKNIRIILLERNIWEVALSKYNRIKGFDKKVKDYFGIKTKSIYHHIFFSFIAFKINRQIINEIQRNTQEKVTKRIKYLNLTENTQQQIEDLCSFIGLTKFKAPLYTNESKEKIHAIAGSPSRSVKKRIQPDIRWKKFYKNKPIALTLGKLLQPK